MRTYIALLSLLNVCSMVPDVHAQPAKNEPYEEVLPESSVQDAEAFGTCYENYLEAENRYFRGLFEDTIQILAGCWKTENDRKGLNVDQQTEVMLMLAISNLYLDRDAEMEVQMRHLMRKVNPDFRASVEEHPLEIQRLARQFRPRWYQKPWVVGVTGAVVGGGIVCALICGQDPLPGPPDLPARPN